MPRLTRERVQHLVGKSRLDDHCIAEIVRTGASELELVEAVNRVVRGGEVGAEKMRPISLNVAKLCEILNSASDPYSEPD
ncbi:MAG: hypothetical protein U1E66_08325 [Rhodospirillales bacterium]